MRDIDVIITVLPGSDRKMLARCIWSLSDEPVNVYFVNGRKGRIGYGRAESLFLGKAPYIAFVDHDDEIEPGIFEKIKPLLEDDPVHVYTDEILMNAEGKPICHGWSVNPELLRMVPTDLVPTLYDDQNNKYFHHLNVFSRKDAMSFVPELYNGNRGIEGHLFQHLNKMGKVKYLSEVGYRWRLHQNNGSSNF